MRVQIPFKEFEDLVWCLDFQSVFKPVFCAFPGLQKTRCFSIKTPEEKQPSIFNETFFLKCTCTRTHDNINLFLRETRNVENSNVQT
jgi:hypothetical protein